MKSKIRPRTQTDILSSVDRHVVKIKRYDGSPVFGRGWQLRAMCSCGFEGQYRFGRQWVETDQRVHEFEAGEYAGGVA